VLDPDGTVLERLVHGAVTDIPALTARLRALAIQPGGAP
jgi:hypothetical protein